MSRQREYLGGFEHLVLLAVLRLRGKGYGVSILEELLTRTGRFPSIGAVYTTLDRLEKKGFVTSHLSDPTPERGGRRKRIFELSAKGERALNDTSRAIDSMRGGKVTLVPDLI